MLKNKEYQYLYMAQFICSILVVIIHSGTLFDNEAINFFIKNILSRIAVPFFIVNNAFFYRAKDNISARQWFKKNLMIYIFWSIVYLPFGLQFISEQAGIPVTLYPVALLFGLFYSGVFFHLWYFPALFFSLFLISKLVKRFGYLKTFVMCMILFLIGSVETYLGYISNTEIKQWIDLYLSIFFTTRNGLFFSSIFVLIGFIIYDKKEFLLQHKNWLLAGIILSSFFICLEGSVIFANQGKDKNFLIMLIPLIFFLFPLLLKPCQSNSMRKLKAYGQGIFFIHLIPIQLLNIFVFHDLVASPFIGWIQFIFSILLSILIIELSSEIGELKKRRLVLFKKAH